MLSHTAHLVLPLSAAITPLPRDAAASRAPASVRRLGCHRRTL
jgi:hypothetical protein